MTKSKLEELRAMREQRKATPAAANTVSQGKYRIVTGYDYHRAPTVFAVVDQDGIEMGRYVSEWEAQAAIKAAEATEVEAAAAEN